MSKNAAAACWMNAWVIGLIWEMDMVAGIIVTKCDLNAAAKSKGRWLLGFVQQFAEPMRTTRDGFLFPYHAVG